MVEEDPIWPLFAFVNYLAKQGFIFKKPLTGKKYFMLHNLVFLAQKLNLDFGPNFEFDLCVRGPHSSIMDDIYEPAIKEYVRIGDYSKTTDSLDFSKFNETLFLKLAKDKDLRELSLITYALQSYSYDNGDKLPTYRDDFINHLGETFGFKPKEIEKGLSILLSENLVSFSKSRSSAPHEHIELTYLLKDGIQQNITHLLDEFLRKELSIKHPTLHYTNQLSGIAGIAQIDLRPQHEIPSTTQSDLCEKVENFFESNGLLIETIEKKPSVTNYLIRSH